jgi:hypothetical protein
MWNWWLILFSRYKSLPLGSVLYPSESLSKYLGFARVFQRIREDEELREWYCSGLLSFLVFCVKVFSKSCSDCYIQLSFSFVRCLAFVLNTVPWLIINMLKHSFLLNVICKAPASFKSEKGQSGLLKLAELDKQMEIRLNQGWPWLPLVWTKLYQCLLGPDMHRCTCLSLLS